MPPQIADQQQTRLVNREIVLLLFLAAIAAAAILVTRAVANHDRQVNARDAAAWYDIGLRALQEQRLEEAVDTLRRATVKDRDNRQYGVALTRALAAAGRTGEATQLLLKLRESSPEDPEINAQLARLAAGRDEVSDTVRYYHSAIYGVWPADQSAARQDLRVELIRFLLAHGKPSNAVAELLALSSNLTDEVKPRLETGRMFLEAGDPRHALDEFALALHAAPDDPDVLAGAGEAAFHLGDYTGAIRYFRRAARLTDRAADLNRVATLVLAHDPRAPRLTLQQRRQRLVEGVARVRRRLDECAAQAPAGGGRARAELDRLQGELRAFEPKLQAQAMRDAPEVVDLGVDLLYRVAQGLAQHCGSPTELDRAWLLIGQRYGAQER